MCVGKKIFANGWLQGSFLSTDDHQYLPDEIQKELEGDRRCAVITQSCDLVHDSMENEPYAELLIFNQVGEKGNGPFKNAKNGRKLHTVIIKDGEPIYYECRATDRYLIPRDKLTTVTPDEELTFPDDSLVILKQWLANRYSRTAFPHKFNQRINEKNKALNKIFSKSADNITGYLISLSSWDELPDDRPYIIDILATMLGSDFDDEKKRRDVHNFVQELAKILDSCDGIEVDDYGVESEDVVTLTQLREMYLWPLDFLSLAPESAGELPAS